MSDIANALTRFGGAGNRALKRANIGQTSQAAGTVPDLNESQRFKGYSDALSGLAKLSGSVGSEYVKSTINDENEQAKLGKQWVDKLRSTHSDSQIHSMLRNGEIPEATNPIFMGQLNMTLGQSMSFTSDQTLLNQINNGELDDKSWDEIMEIRAKQNEGNIVDASKSMGMLQNDDAFRRGLAEGNDTRLQMLNQAVVQRQSGLAANLRVNLSTQTVNDSVAAGVTGADLGAYYAQQYNQGVYTSNASRGTAALSTVQSMANAGYSPEDIDKFLNTGLSDGLSVRAFIDPASLDSLKAQSSTNRVIKNFSDKKEFNSFNTNIRNVSDDNIADALSRLDQAEDAISKSSDGLSTPQHDLLENTRAHLLQRQQVLIDGKTAANAKAAADADRSLGLTNGWQAYLNGDSNVTMAPNYVNMTKEAKEAAFQTMNSSIDNNQQLTPSQKLTQKLKLANLDSESGFSKVVNDYAQRFNGTLNALATGSQLDDNQQQEYNTWLQVAKENPALVSSIVGYEKLNQFDYLGIAETYGISREASAKSILDWNDPAQSELRGVKTQAYLTAVQKDPQGLKYVFDAMSGNEKDAARFLFFALGQDGRGDGEAAKLTGSIMKDRLLIAGNTSVNKNKLVGKGRDGEQDSNVAFVEKALKEADERNSNSIIQTPSSNLTAKDGSRVVLQINSLNFNGTDSVGSVRYISEKELNDYYEGTLEADRQANLAYFQGQSEKFDEFSESLKDKQAAAKLRDDKRDIASLNKEINHIQYQWMTNKSIFKSKETEDREAEVFEKQNKVATGKLIRSLLARTSQDTMIGMDTVKYVKFYLKNYPEDILSTKIKEDKRYAKLFK